MKTAEEQQFDELLDEYYKKFGVKYPINITDMEPTKVYIKRIKNAIRDNKPVAEEPLQPDNTY